MRTYEQAMHTHPTNAISGDQTLKTRLNMIQDYYTYHCMIIPKLDIGDQATYNLGVTMQH